MIEKSKAVNGPSKSLDPFRDFDVHGHLIPKSEEERRIRFEEGSRILANLVNLTDETDADELWDEVLKNLGVDPATGGPLNL